MSATTRGWPVDIPSVVDKKLHDALDAAGFTSATRGPATVSVRLDLEDARRLTELLKESRDHR